MPVEAAGNLAQSQRLAGCQGIERELQAAALLQMPGLDGCAASFVVNHAQAAIGRLVEPVNVAVQANTALLVAI